MKLFIKSIVLSRAGEEAYGISKEYLDFFLGCSNDWKCPPTAELKRFQRVAYNIQIIINQIDDKRGRVKYQF